MSSEKIEAYWKKYAKAHNLSSDLPDYWMFGDGSKKMGDELGALVVQGIKTGTCAAHCLFELEGEQIPEVGQYNIVLDGDEEPLAIIQYSKVEFIKMKDVSLEFIQSEGEGDLSYDCWYTGHEKFFTRVLRKHGLEFTPDLLLVCQTFQVVDIYHQVN